MIAPKTIESRPLCAHHHSLVPFHLPSVKAAGFWMIVAFFMLFRSHLRQRRIFIFIFFVAICGRQTITKRPPPYVSPQLRAFSNVSPPTADTDFQLVVVSPGLMAATYGHGPFPLSHNFRRYN
jgi:hypothetical protein